jgi:hypothetical protein
VRFTQIPMLNPNRRSTQFTATSLSLAALGLAIVPQVQAEETTEPIASPEPQNQQLQPRPLAKAMALKTCQPCRPLLKPQPKLIAQAEFSAPQIATNPDIDLTPTDRGLNLERIVSIRDRQDLAQASSSALALIDDKDPDQDPDKGPNVATSPAVTTVATPVNRQPIAQVPDPAPIAPGTSTDPSSSIEDKLRRLEERQQQLVDEIDGLKTQLKAAPIAKPAKPIVPSRPQGFYGKADVLMLKPGTTSSVDYAITDPLLGEFTATGGTLQKVDLDRQTNVRWGIGYRQHPWDIGFQTLSLKSSTSGSAQKPIDGTLYPTLTSPLQNNNADTANAKLNVRFTSTDLEAGYTLQPSDRFDIRLFSGLRIADTEQKFNVKYDGADFTDGEFRFKRNFSGIGPRLGAEARVNLGSGFSVFGRASGSLLIGNSKLKLRETNDSGNEVVASVSDRNQQQSIPVAEAALGMNWTQAIGKQAAFNLGLGYEYQHWFNAFDNARFVDSQAPGAFQTNRGDINFGGFFIEAGVAAKF